ncbi:DUF6544 family protein [Nonomuraea salmonea]|uniref:DUF6544 family protein n=1 Tax=Nonomuraea salmonea TaxID=46181 RepID=UPI0031E59E99
MTVVLAPPHLTQQARHDWDLLQAGTPAPRPFDPAEADLLPEPARRWVLHAIEAGTPLLCSAVLRMRGDIRLGRWRRFEALQVLAPMEGFVWTARAWMGALPVSGFDRYRAGVGEMRWRLLDAVPVMSGTGPDITRSAAGRLACEFVMAPAAALDPRLRWKPLDDDRVIAVVPVGGEDFDVTLTVAPPPACSPPSPSNAGAIRTKGRSVATCSGWCAGTRPPSTGSPSRPGCGAAGGRGPGDGLTASSSASRSRTRCSASGRAGPFGPRPYDLRPCKGQRRTRSHER